MSAIQFPFAIVVPAYKSRYLHAALTSIAAQTDQRFALYVCDDGSPEDLGAIYRNVFPDAPKNRTFLRFEDNLGGRSLVQQWHRCVAQTQGEPWIWLFSDDDIADQNCVAAFYQAWEGDRGRGEEVSVYRFNTTIVNAEGVCFLVSPPHPARESGLQFAYHRLTGQRNSFAPDHIFARAAFNRCGGFVEFPFALGSDDASWIVFSEGSLIRTIEGPYVYWRWGSENTSSVSGRKAVPKLLAMLTYSFWLEARFAGQVLPPDGLPSSIDIGRLVRQRVIHHLNNVQKLLSWAEIETVASALHGREGFAKRDTRLRLYRSNLRYIRQSLATRVKLWLHGMGAGL